MEATHKNQLSQLALSLEHEDKAKENDFERKMEQDKQKTLSERKQQLLVSMESTTQETVQVVKI